MTKILLKAPNVTCEKILDGLCCEREIGKEGLGVEKGAAVSLPLLLNGLVSFKWAYISKQLKTDLVIRHFFFLSVFLFFFIKEKEKNESVLTELFRKKRFYRKKKKKKGCQINASMCFSKDFLNMPFEKVILLNEFPLDSSLSNLPCKINLTIFWPLIRQAHNKEMPLLSLDIRKYIPKL